MSVATANVKENYEVYERELPRLIERHDGEFAVIHERAVRHLSSTFEEALTWAYENYGLVQNFLVQEVKEGGDVAFFTRDLGPCRR